MNNEKWYSDTENIYKGYEIKIENDDDAQDPRTAFDPMGHMVCFHSRYILGDKHNFSAEHLKLGLAQEVAPNIDATVEYWENKGYEKRAETDGHQAASDFVEKKIDSIIDKILDRYYIILPLYLYDHSGITMSTGAFSCPWDSGQVGIIYMTLDEVKKEYGSEPEAIDRAKNYLKGEVKEYDHFLTGDVFGWSVYDPDGNFLDSCWGYYGFNENIDDIMGEVKNIIDNNIAENEAAEREAERLEKEAQDFVKNCFAL